MLEWDHLSDHVGHKPVFLSGMLGTVLYYLAWTRVPFHHPCFYGAWSDIFTMETVPFAYFVISAASWMVR